MLIDFHTHVFPDALAPRTISKLAEISECLPQSDGTVAGLLAKMNQWGVDMAVTLHIATKPGQQTNVNNFAASIQGERLLSFGSIHPDAPDALQELERIKALGLHGVKLHPDYQDFFVDESRLFPLYSRMAELKLPLVLHCGWDPFSPSLTHCPPHRLAMVLKAFPELVVIGAHLGGMNQYDEAERCLAGRYPNLYMDLSMSPRYCSDPAQFLRIIRAQGADHVLFGTDCPWGSGHETLTYLRSAGLTSSEEKQILFQNACRLLGISPR